MNMILVEFIEAIGRIADKLAIPHYIEDEITNDGEEGSTKDF
jgi:hypothetical protein